MHGSIEDVLDHIARRGSWWGGGSAAALSAALSAALAEKLTATAAPRRRLQGLRRACLRLCRADAEAFAQVVRASRAGHRETFARSLKAATEIPYEVLAHACRVERVCEELRRAIPPRFRSDLICAQALARAASTAARGFIDTNLAWLDDLRYARRMRRRVAIALRRDGR